MRALCILCQKRPPIENSHVVPKFVIKRLKNGNPLGTLIHSNKVRRVFQDGWKGDYLCTECEGLFCEWEDWMCKNVYDPFLAKGDVSLSYDERLGLFVASVCFRYIQKAIDENPQKPVQKEFSALFENLRASLFKKDFSAITSHLYIQFLKPVEAVDFFPPGINTYFFEAIDGKCFSYHIDPNVTWMVYVKIPGLFMILSGWDLKRVFPSSSAVNSHSIKATGALDSASQSGELAILVKDIMKERTLEIQWNYTQMSPERLAKNQAKIEALPNKEEYRAHNSYALDQKLLELWNQKQSAK